MAFAAEQAAYLLHIAVGRNDLAASWSIVASAGGAYETTAGSTRAPSHLVWAERYRLDPMQGSIILRPPSRESTGAR